MMSENNHYIFLQRFIIFFKIVIDILWFTQIQDKACYPSLGKILDYKYVLNRKKLLTVIMSSDDIYKNVIHCVHYG